ncbi:MAG: ABC transporter ATP-binding protein [Gallionellaceae bacterium]
MQASIATANPVVICANQLGKSYHIYRSPRDRLKQFLWQGRRRFFSEFWALRDISLTINRGETVGIIGRNGSGKSTLLQIIAGILTPTTGSAKVLGRVAALLELGSGFNPDFSGRENVFLNAAILGLTQDEIEHRYDKIAAFAGIGAFIDQPVNTFSSGMVLRLAFAVAIHVDADILIVDEALAVGDEAFQRKCFSRIESFQRNGGTLLFVSHSAAAIVELCNRAILLDQGEMLMDGEPKHVVATYHKLVYATADKAEELRHVLKEGAADNQDRSAVATAAPAISAAPRGQDHEFFSAEMKPNTVYYAPRGAHISSTRILTRDGRQVNGLVVREEYVFNYRVKFDRDVYRVQFGMLLKTLNGIELGGAKWPVDGDAIPFVAEGEEFEMAFTFHCLLLPGTYFLNAGVLGLADDQVVFLDRHVDAVMFKVMGLKDSIATEKVDFCISAELTGIQGDQRA